MLPRPDDTTISRYLLIVADTINRQIELGLTGDAAARLRECATVAARVAQQIDARSRQSGGDALAEAQALEAGEIAFVEAEERRAAARRQPPPASSRRIDRAEVEAVLRRHPRGGKDIRVTDARLLPGGRCKITALITQEGSRNLPDAFILRQDWELGATDTTVAKEFSLLERVVAAGIRAPRPLALEADKAALGAPFILVERIGGRVQGGLFSPPRSRSLGLQLAEQLGRLHGMPIGQFDDLGPAPRFSPETLLEGIAKFREAQAAIGIHCQTIDAAIDWLADHVGDAGSATTLTHNDVGFHNILVEGEELTAILDWELAQLGHPAADLGYIKHFVEQMMPWADFVECYKAAGGWRIDPAALRFHTVWNAVRLYGLIMKARAALASGLTNDIQIAFSCANNLMLMIRCLARELREAGAY